MKQIANHANLEQFLLLKMVHGEYNHHYLELVSSVNKFFESLQPNQVRLERETVCVPVVRLSLHRQMSGAQITWNMKETVAKQVP